MHVSKFTFFSGAKKDRYAKEVPRTIGTSGSAGTVIGTISNGTTKACAVYRIHYVDSQGGTAVGHLLEVRRATGITDGGLGSSGGQLKDTHSGASTAVTQFFPAASGSLDNQALLFLAPRSVNTAGLTRFSGWAARDRNDAIILQPEEQLAFISNGALDSDARLSVGVHWDEL